MKAKEIYNIVSKKVLDDETINRYNNTVNEFFILKHYEQNDLLNFLYNIVRRIPCYIFPINKNDFVKSEFTGYIEHNMYDRYMSKEDDFKVFNSLAYGLNIKHTYDEETNEETNEDTHSCDALYLLGNDNNGITVNRLYISKGGIVNGDFIDYCYIKRNYINYIEPIVIPASVINTTPSKGFYCICIDHREPKLKELMDKYDCNFGHDDNIKFNIRKFIKLKSK